MSFKKGDRVRHMELIVKGYGTVTKVHDDGHPLGQNVQVKWDSLTKRGLHYGVYLRPVESA